MKTKLNVQSIFDSIDGEANGFDGAGQLTTFIRLKGCNLRCRYCDTKYAQNAEPENWMTIDEIIQQVHFPKVTITGGEVLVQREGLIYLLFGLRNTKRMKQVSIETNGSMEIPFEIEYHKGTPYHWTDVTLIHDDRIRWVVDFKLPSSGMMKHMNSMVFNSLRSFDVIKFVISDMEDYKCAKMLIQEHPGWKAKKVMSPTINIVNFPSIALEYPELGSVFVNPAWPRQLVETMIRDKVDAQFSLQIHKILWPGTKEER